MKKILNISVKWLVITFLCMFFLIGILGKEWSVHDMLGCYVFKEGNLSKKVCLYDSGRYEQFFSRNNEMEKKVNGQSWRTFVYDEENSVAGVLSNYASINEEGDVTGMNEMDIRARKNVFGTVYFRVGSVHYIRE